MAEAMPTHPATLSDADLLGQCTSARGRRGGPGGQHRNKVETHVTLTHTPTGVAAQAGERRSQADNKRVALSRLRLALAIAVRTQPSGPSALWSSRCRGGGVAGNPSHGDCPALLAEALDAIAAAEWEPGPAAERLGCTSSQLIKLLKKHPPALQHWNRRREERDLRPLR